MNHMLELEKWQDNETSVAATANAGA